MKYKKENLLKLLELVNEVSMQLGNEWFLEKLHNKYSKKSVAESSGSDSLESKVNLIRDYLSIDLNRVIDYSDFEEPSRESLFRDCIEMGRYEKGTPSHKIDFGEFCRYAHLQAEEIINYFLSKKSDLNVGLIFQFIQEKVPSYKPDRKPAEVHHIFYTSKLSAFKSISNLSKKSIDVFWFLNEFRNELSHRNSLTISSEDNDLALFEQSGYLKSQIDFKKFTSKQWDIFNRGTYIIRKRKKDFNLIYESLEDLKQQVIVALRNLKELPIKKYTIGNSNPILQELKNKIDEAGSR